MEGVHASRKAELVWRDRYNSDHTHNTFAAVD